MGNYRPVIGLEVHAQLSTQSKLFCSCKVEFGAEPNTLVCPVCLGMPGVLPTPNRLAISYAVMLGLATGCEINPKAMWTRKNYFYPDLPKGYQVTQQGGSAVYDQPICRHGCLTIENDRVVKKIGITRIHMEEDAGKLIHDLTLDDSLFDANRCGTPLVEVVSEPDLRSPREAYLYLEKLKQILEYLGICDANMERGNLRCDANISLRKNEEAPFGPRVEIKNMNSFHNLERALHSEIELQTLMLDNGETVAQVTKRWDPAKGTTVLMRAKEGAEDYRYFPEPDLIRLRLVDEEFIHSIRQQLPELPEDIRQRFQKDYGLSEYDAHVLTLEKEISHYYEKCARETNNPKAAANWVMGEALRVMKERGEKIEEIPIQAERLGELIRLIDKKVISGRIAKEIFEEMLTDSDFPGAIVKKKGMEMVSDSSEIRKFIETVLSQNPEQLTAYKNGKTKLMGFFVGEVMKASQGKASPLEVNKLLAERMAKG